MRFKQRAKSAPGVDAGDHRLLTVNVPRPFPWQRRARHEIFSGSARFVLLVMGRRAGKTTVCADISGRNALSRHHGDNLWGAPTFSLAKIGREKLHSMFGPVIEASETMDPVDRFYGGGNVRWRSFNVDSGAIGRGNGLVVIDEAARVKEKIIYEDVFPTVADTGGKIIGITTPRGRRNWTFDWYCRATGGDKDYAVIHGPSTDNPSPFVRDFIDVARRTMPDTLFRQEILAEFVEGEGDVFRRIREAATLPDFMPVPPSPHAKYVIGCDLAKHQDYTVMYAMDRQTKQVHGGDRFQHVDWPLQEARIKAFARLWNNATVFLDSTGVGDSTFDHLLDSGVPVEPVTLTTPTKNNLIRGLSVALENAEIAFPADPVLISELESYAYEVSKTGVFRYSAPEGLHDDCVIALSLALFGADQRTSADSWLSWGDRAQAGGAGGQKGWRRESV